MNAEKKVVKKSGCLNVGDLSGCRVPENFTARRINLPESDGSFFSDLAGPPLCTGIIFAVFQSVGDIAPFKNKAGTTRGERQQKAVRLRQVNTMLPPPSALFFFRN